MGVPWIWDIDVHSTNESKMTTGPTINRHRSKQDYSTPIDFMDAVRRRFGRPTFDLAASSDNTKCTSFYSVEQDSLEQDWHMIPGLLWLNPPFNNIAPWARKCAEESEGRGAQILLLTPASVGSNWFQDHVHGKAMVYALNPRLSFDGQNPFPKDCILSYFGFGVSGFGTWRWK